MVEDLRVLMVEDSEEEARRMAKELERAGFQIRWLRVDDRSELATALEEASWDLALLDDASPRLDLETALGMVHEARPEVPAILLTGTPAETEARLMRAGAADFVSKANLSLLAPAVAREVGAARIRERMAALEEEVREQLAEIRRVQEEARAKNQFVNAISHELRTPLTSILGYAELLEDEIGGPLTDQQREFLKQIVEAALRQERVVNDLLDYARSEAGTFQLRLAPFDFRSVLEATVESLRPQAAKVHVTLVVAPMPAPQPIVADAQRIGQVVLNFLTNAIKFSPPGGTVEIRSTHDGEALAFEVRDHGPGIAPEDVPKLFQLFSQLDNGRIRGGTGLGLAISRTIVESHGGRIGVRPHDGEGSTFWFRLPANRVAAPDES